MEEADGVLEPEEYERRKEEAEEEYNSLPGVDTGVIKKHKQAEKEVRACCPRFSSLLKVSLTLRGRRRSPSSSDRSRRPRTTSRLSKLRRRKSRSVDPLIARPSLEPS